MGIEVEPDTIEETFMIMGLHRMQVTQIKRDAAFLRAMNGDQEKSIEAFNEYMNYLIPQLRVSRKHKDVEMMSAFNRFKSSTSQIRLNERGQISLRRVKDA